ncbi:MAG: hypothetical protein R6V17_05405, partial [Halanaerobacter sp.]
MDFKRIFSSSQIMMQFLLYIVGGLVLSVGIGLVAYEVMDIVTLQQSVGEFEEGLEQQVQELNKYLQTEAQIEIREEEKLQKN